MGPALAEVCRIDVDVGPIQDLGAMPLGRRRIVAINGGTVEGARLTASILPGGADWQHVRGDGILELVARYAIRTHDGVEIAITNRGLRRASPEDAAAMARGEAVDPARVYFRAVPQFEAPAGRYDWLNRSLFLATGVRLPARVQITVFEVL